MRVLKVAVTIIAFVQVAASTATANVSCLDNGTCYPITTGIADNSEIALERCQDKKDLSYPGLGGLFGTKCELHQKHKDPNSNAMLYRYTSHSKESALTRVDQLVVTKNPTTLSFVEESVGRTLGLNRGLGSSFRVIKNRGPLTQSQLSTVFLDGSRCEIFARESVGHTLDVGEKYLLTGASFNRIFAYLTFRDEFPDKRGILQLELEGSAIAVEPNKIIIECVMPRHDSIEHLFQNLEGTFDIQP